MDTQKCQYCGSKEVIKRGMRSTQNRGKIQRYSCKDCKKRFVVKDAFYRMRNSQKKITCAIDLFFRGVSTRKIQEHFRMFYPHNCNNATIYRWIIRYSEQISSFTDTLKVNTGAEIQVDEVEFHRRKSHKASLGVAKNWLIDSIDVKTRYAVAVDFVEHRSKENIKSVMKNIKRKSDNVEVITTDGFMAYTKVVKKTFGYDKHTKSYKVKHNQVNASQGEGFNYPVERMHNNIRARTKVMRGFHGSVYSARTILKGMFVYYNFITKHQGINCTPASLATDIKLENPNKWLELINLSTLA